MAVSQEGTGMEDLHPHTLTSHVGLGTIHPHLVTSGTTVISRRGLMIVDINHNHLPDHPSTGLHVDRHRTTVTSMVRLSSLVINVDHHLGVDIRRHVGGRISRRHEDALVHEDDNTINMAVAILMNDVVVHVIVMVIDHHTEGTLSEALTFRKEVDTKDPNPVGKQIENVAAHVREKGMACIRRGDGTYDYKFERNRASNSGAEADNDEDGSPGVLVITREDIIENINKNPTMTRTEKRLTRASVKKRFDLEVRMEAKRRGYTDRSKAVRRAARAIRRGANPDNRCRVLRDVPLSPEDPYSSEGVYSEEGLKHSKAGRGQGSATSGPAEKDKAVATSGSVEEDNAVATSDPTTMQGEAVADPEHKDDQASTAVAVSASAEKPAMGLVSATSSLNTSELTWVIDTGATSHMCKYVGLFVTFEPLESNMETAANPLRILGKGTARFPVKDATNAVRSVERKNVNYVPRVAHNLLSVTKALVNDGFKININKRELYTLCVYFLIRKWDEVYHVYEDLRRKVKEKIKYIYTVVSEYDDEIKRVQSDNGKEYEKLARIIAKYNTHFRFTQAYTPQQNGMAERRIRMVMEKTLCLLFDGHLSGAQWGEAVMTSTYLVNITPTHAVKCIFVGYDEDDRSGYRLLRLLDCEVIHSRDVRFNEAEFPRFADRVLAALPDQRQRLCGCHHCDDHLAKATASVEAILRDEDAVTKDHLRRRQRRTGEATYSTSSGTNSRRRTGEVTYSTSSGTEQIRELSASEAMDNQALPRTSEVIGASEASAAFGEQRTGASQLEQPIQAGSAQVGETLLPVIIESGDDRTVVPQRAVSPRSGEITRTRTDHPSTWSVEAHTHGTTIGNRSEIQSHNEGHPTSVDASRSQADVHREPTQSGHVRLQSNPIASTRSRELPVLDERAVEWFQQFIADEVNKRLHNDKDSGQMSFLSRERGSCVSSHSNHYNYKYSRPIQHCVRWRQRNNAEYATSMGAGVGECETLCRECTGRQNGVASMVARRSF
ncbi:unnamed protein product [Phytophthora fragariaefolia]|uniref:Unnamed protein product n=1 Tax=Phytophthora fragariaefolia TaxID=1490495 RepID=A0A9W7DFQ3_9STRA|nr:unnamed protein product [Phytophthora fragariaefolia]